MTAVWLALALLLGFGIGAAYEGCRRGGSLDLQNRVLRAEIAGDDAVDELAARKRHSSGHASCPSGDRDCTVDCGRCKGGLRSVPTAQDGAWIAASLQEHARRNGAS